MEEAADDTDVEEPVGEAEEVAEARRLSLLQSLAALSAQREKTPNAPISETINHFLIVFTAHGWNYARTVSSCKWCLIGLSINIMKYLHHTSGYLLPSGGFPAHFHRLRGGRWMLQRRLGASGLTLQAL